MYPLTCTLPFCQRPYKNAGRNAGQRLPLRRLYDGLHGAAAFAGANACRREQVDRLARAKKLVGVSDHHCGTHLNCSGFGWGMNDQEFGRRWNAKIEEWNKSDSCFREGKGRREAVVSKMKMRKPMVRTPDKHKERKSGSLTEKGE